MAGNLVCLFSDLERSVEEMRAGAGLNHKLVTEQEVEQKSQELRRLGETLTDLKSECHTHTHTHTHVSLCLHGSHL